MLNLSILDKTSMARVCHALSTEMRLNIIQLLEHQTLSCLELSRILGYPMSTISANIKILEAAGLVSSQLLPARNGSKKLCSLVYSDIMLSLVSGEPSASDLTRFDIEIPIGNYMDFMVAPTCGFLTRDPVIKKADFDNPNYFLSPARLDAQLIWFRKGYLEYRIPLDNPRRLPLSSLSFGLELCSEAPGYNNLLKSDITMWVNGVEIGTYQSQGDYGGRRGTYSPAFWDLDSTQYGKLTTWKITQSSSLINDTPVSAVTLDDLRLLDAPFVTMRIGIREDAVNQGGINLFGESFGDYPQAIKMSAQFQPL